MILETHLYNFIAKSEHYGVLSSHPLLHVDDWLILISRRAGRFILHFNVAVNICRLAACGAVSPIRSILRTVL